MDLYGDLPPSSEGSSDLIAPGGWAGETLVRQASKPVSQVNKKESAVVSKPAVAQSSQEVVKPPNSSTSIKIALFKPRQATNQPRASNHPALKRTLPQPTPSQAQFDHTNASSHERTEKRAFIEPTALPDVSLNFECEDEEYDPRRPNDYLAYCDERAEIRRLEKVAEENQLILEDQQRARALKEAEQKDALERGDIKKLQDIMAGKGRGRGLSNLPSWMTDIALSGTIPKIDDISERNSVATVEKEASGLSVTVKPSKVLKFVNMVVADKLHSAEALVTSECSKYGSVLACKVLVDIVFVQFESLSSAANAYRSLNGRILDDRQVTASFFDEELFRSGNLK